MRTLCCALAVCFATGCGRSDVWRFAAAPGPDDDDGQLDAGGPPDAGCASDPAELVSATVRVTTDDSFTLYVNGVLIDGTERLWTAPQRYTVSLFRHPSRTNTLAIRGLNRWNVDGRDRGMILDLSVDLGGHPFAVLSDRTWRASASASPGWQQGSFDEHTWLPPADEGPHGVLPWGSVLGTTDAHWLWLYDSNRSAASKPMIEEAFFRKTFTLPPAVCP